MNIKWIGCHSNNFGKGRNSEKVKYIVLHWIAGTLESADATFANPNRKASAHYGIGGNTIHQYVKEEDTAWHCGNLTKNRQSIGIEHEGGPELPISEATIQTSIKLVADLCKRYTIPADRTHIFKHSEIKPTQCPGTLPVERIVEEVSKLLSPAPPALTDDEHNALKLLRDFKMVEVNLKDGNLEGAQRAVIDAYKGLQKAIADSLTKTEIINSFELQVSGLTAELNTYKENQQKLSDMLSCDNNHPKIVSELSKLLKKENQKERTNFLDWLKKLIGGGKK